MELTDVLSAIQGGDMDDYLDIISDAIERQRKVVSSNVKIGARIVIRDNISPKYLGGVTGEVTVVAPGKITMKVDEAYRGNGRYSRYVSPLDHTVRLPADLVREL